MSPIPGVTSTRASQGLLMAIQRFAGQKRLLTRGERAGENHTRRPPTQRPLRDLQLSPQDMAAAPGRSVASKIGASAQRAAAARSLAVRTVQVNSKAAGACCASQALAASSMRT